VLSALRLHTQQACHGIDRETRLIELPAEVAGGREVALSLVERAFALVGKAEIVIRRGDEPGKA